MRVIEIVVASVWFLGCAFIVGGAIYFNVIEPLYRAIRNFIRARCSLNRDARAEEGRDM